MFVNDLSNNSIAFLGYNLWSDDAFIRGSGQENWCFDKEIKFSKTLTHT